MKVIKNEQPAPKLNADEQQDLVRFFELLIEIQNQTKEFKKNVN